MLPDSLDWGRASSAASVFTAALVAIITTLFIVAFYAFYSIVLYQLAKKKDVAHPWMAWIPYLNNYIIGEIAGPMHVLGRFELRNTGLWLFLSPIVVAGVSQVLENYSSIPLIGGVFSVLSGIVGALGSIAALLFLCLVLYRIFSRYVPKNITLVFSILSIFAVTVPFFLASILNKPQISEGYDFIV